MIKRIIAAVLAAAALLTFTACGKDKETAADTAVTAPVRDLEETYQSLLAMQADTGLSAPVMFAEDSTDVIEQLYSGLSQIKLTQRVAYMSPVTSYACEVLLVEAADPADVPAITDIFNARINIGAVGSGDAESRDVWSRNAKVQTSGSCVAMIVLPDGYIIPENIFEYSPAPVE